MGGWLDEECSRAQDSSKDLTRIDPERDGEGEPEKTRVKIQGKAGGLHDARQGKEADVSMLWEVSHF